MLSIFVIATSLLSVAQAQYGGGGYGGGSDSTSSAAAAMTSSAMPAMASGTPTVHNVTVGLGGLVFNPSNISAAVGDIVNFSYHPKNHSVTQSSFKTPCFHLADATGAPVGRALYAKS